MRTFCVLVAIFACTGACEKKREKPPDLEHIAPGASAESRSSTPSQTAPTDLYGDELPEKALARLGSLRMVDRAIQHMHFSPDGTRVLSNTLGGYRLWDVTDASTIRTLKSDQGSAVIALSPDGRHMATGTVADGTLLVWDLESGVVTDTIQGHADPATALCYLDDGHLVSAAGDGRLKLWNLEKRTETRSLQGAWNTITAVACDPSSGWIAFGSEKGGAYALAPGSDVAIELGGGDRRINRVAIGPGGRPMAFATASESLLLWPRAEALEPRRIQAHENAVHDLAFSPDGSRLYSSGGGFVVPHLGPKEWGETR